MVATKEDGMPPGRGKPGQQFESLDISSWKEKPAADVPAGFFMSLSAGSEA